MVRDFLTKRTWTSDKGAYLNSDVCILFGTKPTGDFPTFHGDVPGLESFYDWLQSQQVGEEVVVGSYIDEGKSFSHYNSLEPEQIHAVLLNPLFGKRTEGYDKDQVRSSQSQGAEASYSVDPKAARFAIQELDPDLIGLVTPMATVAGSAKGRALAWLKHARSVCIVHKKFQPLLAQHRRFFLATLCPTIDANAYLHCKALVDEFERTGDWDPLSQLDLDGGSHAGFPRNRGVTKKEDAPLSASDLSVYRSTKDPELLKKFCTFNHAVRAKDTPLEEPQVILDQGSRAKASNKVLHAPRVVTYASTPTVALAKPYIEAFTAGCMKNPDRGTAIAPDSFEPGALRRFYQVWRLIFGTKLKGHDK